ncbi:hypothetical protein DM02DRAFT_541747 [Periconia macrospinosa]|uniref:MARVEL domain-containing protein n=1 Tax=Periconia macrospinosa TaxID=97972 RepID=A0A2V1D5N3_9PLEO|nr:hypothetical protein DM02DRAFT_541747 [Periconia macrospinosa]
MVPLARLIAFVATTLELGLATALILLFACAHSNEYRNILWTAGGAQGWNSDPSLRVYFYANYREPPPIPAIWDQSTSAANSCIAAFNAILWFIRLKVNLFSSKGLDLWSVLTTNALYDMLLIALWTTSISLQRAGDFSDNQHLSLSPWYLERDCEDASRDADTACRVGKASYSLSVFTA